MADDTASELSTYHRTLTDGDEDPEVALVQAVADITGGDVTDLPPLHSCVDNMVERLFCSPPPAEAQAELTFSYAGYRIIVYQDGHAVFQQLYST